MRNYGWAELRGLTAWLEPLQEVKPQPGIRLVDAGLILQTIQRQQEAADALGRRWLLHPDNQVKKGAL